MDFKEFIKDLNSSDQLDLLKFLQYDIEVPKFDVLNDSSNSISKAECLNCKT